MCRLDNTYIRAPDWTQLMSSYAQSEPSEFFERQDITLNPEINDVTIVGLVCTFIYLFIFF